MRFSHGKALRPSLKSIYRDIGAIGTAGTGASFPNGRPIGRVGGNKGPEGRTGAGRNGSTRGRVRLLTGSYGWGRGLTGEGRAGEAKPREKGLATIFLSVRSFCLAGQGGLIVRPCLISLDLPFNHKE